MNDSERLDAVVKILLTLRRDHCRGLARLKALEAVLAEALPPDQLAAWYDRVDQLTHAKLQLLLEEFERQNPAFAALLDDREADELHDLD